jgi:hypothetical protein
MVDSKYKPQTKHIREHYKRLPIDLRPDVLDQFKAKCQANNTTPTTEIKKFINQYLREQS